MATLSGSKSHFCCQRRGKQVEQPEAALPVSACPGVTAVRPAAWSRASAARLCPRCRVGRSQSSALRSEGKERSGALLSSSWGLSRPAQAKVAAFRLQFYFPRVVRCPLSLAVPDSLLWTQHLFPLISVWAAIGIDRRWIVSLDMTGGKNKNKIAPFTPFSASVLKV